MVSKYRGISGWYQEKQRHSLARRGISTSKKRPSGKKSFFDDDTVIMTMLTTGNRVHVPDGSVGTVVSVDGGMAKVLTKDGIIDVPASHVEKMTVPQIMGEVESSRETLILIPTKDPREFKLAEYPQIGTKGLAEWKHFYPQKDFKVKTGFDNFNMSRSIPTARGMISAIPREEIGEDGQ